MQILYTGESIVSAIAVAIIGIGTGAEFPLPLMKKYIIFPRVLILSWLLKIVLIPGICFAFARIFNFRNDVATGLMLLSFAPPDIILNLLTFYAKGEAGLSGAFCVFSSLLSVGVVCAGNAIFLRTTFDDDVSRLEYAPNAILTPIFLLVAVLLGIVLRLVSSRLSNIMHRTAKASSLAYMVAVVVWELIDNSDVVIAQEPLLYVAVGLMLLLPAPITYLVTWLFHRNLRRVHRTVSLGVGVQNVAFSVMLITTSTDDGVARKHMLVAPAVYCVLHVIFSSGLTYMYRFYVATRDPPPGFEGMRAGGNQNQSSLGDLDNDDAISLARQSTRNLRVYKKRTEMNSPSPRSNNRYDYRSGDEDIRSPDLRNDNAFDYDVETSVQRAPTLFRNDTQTSL